MARQLLAAMGSTVVLVGAVVALAIVGTGIVVFDRWPSVGGAAPSGDVPLAAGTGTDGRASPDRRFAAGAAVRGGRGAQAAGGARPSGVTGADDSSQPDAATTSPFGSGPGTAVRSPGAGTDTSAVAVAQGGPSGAAPTEQLAGAIDAMGRSAGQGARGGGTAAGETVGAVHAPAGDSTTTSADAAATRMQTAAALVADALRGLPSG